MPQVGDYFVTRTGGWVAKVIRLVTHSKVNHAGVYVGAGRIVEAQPHGARLTFASDYPHAVWSHVPLTTGQRATLRFNAMLVLGTPYGFLDIVALAYAKVLRRATPRFIRRQVERSDRLICSQLVDVVYQRAGIKLFNDGRPAEDVTPGDLYDLIQES